MWVGVCVCMCVYVCVCVCVCVLEILYANKTRTSSSKVVLNFVCVQHTHMYILTDKHTQSKST